MMEPATDAPLKEAAAGSGEPSGADALRTRHRLGAVLVIVVALLYVGSGVAIQTLFDDMNFEKPFLFSYVSVSLCSSYLLHVVYLQSRRSRCRCCTRGERRASYRNLLPDASVDADAEPQLSLVHKPAELLRSAVMLSPAYFALNYTYFLSLDLTTVSETMVISASTGASLAPPAPLRHAHAPPAPPRAAAGIWTLLFSRLILNEPLTRIKLATVFISMAGMILVTFSSSEGDADDENAGDAAAGNAAALMSAAASGIYVVLLRACVPDEVR